MSILDIVCGLHLWRKLIESARSLRNLTGVIPFISVSQRMVKTSRNSRTRTLLTTIYIQGGKAIGKNHFVSWNHRSIFYTEVWRRK